MKTSAYARFSTDRQSEASIEDQARNIRAHCQRASLPLPRLFSDMEISGARTDRPGYRQMLASAERREFDVLLIDDTYRLARDQVEFPRVIRMLKFHGVRVIGVSDGFDSDREGYKLEAGMRGIMGEAYIDSIAKNTHRGLMGRALAGASAGGLPYGYRTLPGGQREIDAQQAAVVRRVFAEYVSGRSPREIAAALNHEGTRSPRGGQWSMSAIYGDVRRGIGILANAIYAGQQIWNRSHFVKHPVTGRRIRRERPQSEWVITEKPELAIVTHATWEAAQARIRGNKHTLTTSAGPGRPPKHLFSGLLRCPECGGPMIVVDRYRYGCARHKDRGDVVCSSRLRVPRRSLEYALLAGIREALLDEAAFKRFQSAATAALKRAAPDLEGSRRKLAEAQKVQANILAAIRAGIFTSSTKAELEDAERAIADAGAELERVRTFQPAQFLPRARERWEAIKERLADVGREKAEAREAIRELVGDRIDLKNENGDLVAEVAAQDCQITVVAGAGFGLYLTEPLRIPIPCSESAKDIRD